MSKLEKLVPPQELCEQIPSGDFLDAAFCWHYTEVAGFVCRTSGCEQFSGKQWVLERSTSGKIVRARERGEQIFPAPTLEEVVTKLRNISIYPDEHGMFWQVVTKTNPEEFILFLDGKMSTAALKLWLELKKEGN